MRQRWRTLAPTTRARVAQHVRARWGLVFEGTRTKALDAGVLRALDELDTTSADLLSRLGEDPSIDGALLRALTVQESYFFRHPSDFDRLHDTLKQAQNDVRLWSVGCAAGEEPISMAIVARRVWGEGADERVKIHASDISPAALERALKGTYRPWSFREMAQETIETFFEDAPGGKSPKDPVRGLVEYFPANLMHPDDSWPEELDVIFCRNVLIYFDFESGRQVLANLARRLKPGGWIALGPTDPSSFDVPELSRRNSSELRIFTRVSPGEPRRDSPGLVSTPEPPARPRPPQPSFVPPPSVADTLEIPPALEASVPEQTDDHVRAAYRMATSGRAMDAEPLIARILEKDPDRAEAYLVRALLKQARRRHREALDDVRRALSLDSSLALAQVVRATSCMGLGDRDRAARALERLRDVAPDGADPEVFRPAEPDDVPFLRDLCNSLQKLLVRRPAS